MNLPFSFRCVIRVELLDSPESVAEIFANSGIAMLEAVGNIAAAEMTSMYELSQLLDAPYGNVSCIVEHGVFGVDAGAFS